MKWLRTVLTNCNRQSQQSTRLSLESLEDRLVMDASIPVLHSFADAPVKLYLDFDGHFEEDWGSYDNVGVPTFDIDDNPESFAAESALIEEIWQHVSEDFAPFNIDVTTEDPGDFSNGQSLRVAIGGPPQWPNDDYTSGISYFNNFTNSIPNTAWVFSDNIMGRRSEENWGACIGTTVSHEAGHSFGLDHQSEYNDDGTIDTYADGTDEWTPIMGANVSFDRTTWHNGMTDEEEPQDDMALLASDQNGFGYRADDHADSLNSFFTRYSTAPTSLEQIVRIPYGPTNRLRGAGIIETMDDQDWFTFTTSMTGTINLRVDVAEVGANLDVKVQLWKQTDLWYAPYQKVAEAAPSDDLGADLSYTGTAGTYYLVVMSHGQYGDVGRYTISGTEPQLSSTQIPMPHDMRLEYPPLELGRPIPQPQPGADPVQYTSRYVVATPTKSMTAYGETTTTSKTQIVSNPRTLESSMMKSEPLARSVVRGLLK